MSNRWMAGLVAVSACATPYQRMGILGGYDDKTIGNGDHLITVKVNGYTDAATALEYLHRRADDLCPEGYDIIDRESADNGGWRFGHKPEVDAVVRCRAATPPVAARAPVAPPSPASAAFRCFSSATDGNVGFCARAASECSESHDREFATTADITPCASAGIATCFRYTNAVDGVSHEACAPTLATCNHRRDAASVAGVGDVGECQEAR